MHYQKYAVLAKILKPEFSISVGQIRCCKIYLLKKRTATMIIATRNMTTTTMTVAIIRTCMLSSSPTIAAMKIYWSSNKCKI
jgi:hypothetical protein